MELFDRIFQIDLLTYSQWLGIITIASLLLTVIAFFFQWGFRFRLVGVTSFMGVVTASVFALGLGLFTRTEIPGAIRYALVFDNAADKVTIAVPSTVTESELDATLRQAAVDIQRFGRVGGPNAQLALRARTVLHPKPGVSQPLYLGQATRGISRDSNADLQISIFSENFAKLPPAEN